MSRSQPHYSLLKRKCLRCCNLSLRNRSSRRTISSPYHLYRHPIAIACLPFVLQNASEQCNKVSNHYAFQNACSQYTIPEPRTLPFLNPKLQKLSSMCSAVIIRIPICNIWKSSIHAQCAPPRSSSKRW